ncbi:sugar transferase [Pseudarthrobacter sp. LMD1-1-1.1]|uniref:sugar transferase n=1 Tax=Pseudarthrobacter sp. LMD1-1-1.1 TaxID=3135242 RepID=UPI00341A1417
MNTSPRNPLSESAKRLTDVILSATGLIITAPVQMVVAALVWRKLGRPVLFKQERPGRFGQTFMLMKFRTMMPVDASSGRVTDAERLTRFGIFLRSTSLDELPTLLNVLKGDMSMVGPRPLLVSYLDRYTPEQSRRHLVRPGITGLAQVRGRNLLSWDEKFRLDVIYVDNRTLLMDLHILFLTIKSVVGRHGISADGSVTMPEFQRRSAHSEAQDV